MKILAISEYSGRGSGYTTIADGLVAEWERRGHRVVLLGFDYIGEQHRHDAAIVATELRTVMTQARYIIQGYKPDVLSVCFDLSIHQQLRALQFAEVPYIGIFPIESDPVHHPSDWTSTIDTMGAALCESRFGTAELERVGIRTTYFPVGVDEFWRPPSRDEREQARRTWNVPEGKFTVLTICDNHERKNLPAHCAAIALLRGEEVRWPPQIGRHRVDRLEPVDAYWIVNTKRRRTAGYDVFDLQQRFNLMGSCQVMEHGPGEGLDRESVRELYWLSDAFLLLSKAEGLGLPVLEAMACGLPVVGTDCTGIGESVADGRGFGIPPEYVHIDPFDNQYRRWPNPFVAARRLGEIARAQPSSLLTRDGMGQPDGAPWLTETIDRAYTYARSFTWERAGDVFDQAAKELIDESSEAKAPAKTARS